MGNKSSSSSSPPPIPVARAPPAISEAVKGTQAVRGTIDRLEKRQEYLEKKIKQALIAAKKSKDEGNNRAALHMLKKKKLYEKEIEGNIGKIMTLEQQAAAIESGSTNAQVIGAMEDARKVQQKIQSQINVEDVEELQADIAELMDESEAVGDILSQGISTGMDEDDLEAELRALEAEDEPVTAQKAPSLNLPEVPTSLPAVPTHTPQIGEMDEETALRELQREMMLES